MRTIYLFKGILVSLMLMISANASAYNFKVDGIYYAITKSGTNYARGEVAVTFKGDYGFSYEEYSGSVTIPSSVSYNYRTYDVTSIGESAFQNCPNLTSVAIPNSVTSIGNSAFFLCI